MSSKRDLSGAIFNTELNDFCRKYFIKGPINPTHDEVIAFPEKYNDLKSSLFESLILNKEVNFKVEGENIPLCIMLNEIGLRGVEELIDEEAISFTLWSPTVLYMVKNLDGITPLCSGRHDSGPYIDPEESINTGLSFMINPLKKGEARLLTKKLRDYYIPVRKGIEHDCVSITMSALESGKLEGLGLNIKEKNKYQLNEQEKKRLTNCAADLLSYKYLIEMHASTSSTSNIKFLLEDSIAKTNMISKEEIYSTIVRLENFPDIKTTFQEMGFPMDELIKLRKSKSSKKFRKWLSEIDQTQKPLEIQKYYMDSIFYSKGFFDTFLGKTTKKISMMMLGTYVGSLVDANIGPYIGAAGSQIADKATDYMLDMADEYLLSELTKGWTPKVFIDDMKTLKFKYSI